VLADVHTEHGVELHLGVGVAGAAAGHVRLDDGTELRADVILEAVGVVPDTQWLVGSGVPLDNGVVCDDSGRVAPDVYAVGDVANWGGHRHEHWTNVGLQADHVAALILAQAIPPADVSYWWSDQYDLKLQGLGRPAADDDVEILFWGPKARTVAVYSSSGRLTGLVGFSAPGAIMRLREDVAAGTDVRVILARLEGTTSRAHI
jgi:3-phenylpropionate/trans-cinnamate dioxygenase ferredoxin reductase subunit